MIRHIISILIENESGALSRVAGLFSARGYNIESLTVAPTEDPSLSRMTLVTRGSEDIIEQITKQLNKLIDVVKLIDLAESMPPADTARLLCWPEGVERDRWCAASIRLFVWSPTPAARLALSFWTPEGVAMQFVEIAAQGATLARSSLDEGQVKRVACLLPEGRGGFVDVTCRFDFTFPLQPPDLRACAAMFAGIEIDQGHGWRGVDLPGGAF